MNAEDPLIPLSVLASRLEKHRDEMRRELAKTPWWKFKDRWILSACAASYDYEHRKLLEWGGGIAMDRLKEKIK